MKIESIRDIEQIEQDHDLNDLIAFDNTYDAIKSSAQQWPGRTALSFFLTGDDHQNAHHVRYGELLKKITQTANMLHQLGLQPGDVVAYVLPNLPETHYVIWGSSAVAQVFAINPLLEAQQMKALLNNAGAKVVVTMNPMPKMDLWEKIESILPELDSVRHVIGVDIAHYVSGFKGVVAGVMQSVKKRRVQLPAQVKYIDFAQAIKTANDSALNFHRSFSKDTVSSLYCTGGTTGLPKIALRSHRNELVNAMSVICASAGMLEAGKTILCGLPLFHVNGTLITGLIPFMQGATVVMVTPQGYRGQNVFNHFWRIIEHFKVTTFSGVPTVYAALLQQSVGKCDISSLEYCMCGAAPMPVEVFKSFEREIGVKILEGYGLTEGTCVSSINPTKGETRIGSIGIRIPFQQMMCATLTAEGSLNRCETNEVGSVYICGDNVFMGYKEQHQNEGLLHKDEQGQVWLDTGDMGRQDEQGYFWLTGRQKELIIRGGHNIEPKLIEEVMCTHPDVSMAAAVGCPDILKGEMPVCYVQVQAGSPVTEQALLEFADTNILERAAIPKAIHIIEALPLTAVGKIFKPALLMKEIEACVKSEIDKLLPDATYSVSVEQDKLLGILATIKIDVNDAQLVTLNTQLGKYTFKFRVEES